MKRSWKNPKGNLRTFPTHNDCSSGVRSWKTLMRSLRIPYRKNRAQRDTAASLPTPFREAQCSQNSLLKCILHADQAQELSCWLLLAAHSSGASHGISTFSHP